MKKKRRLKEIKSIRKIRDEIISENNCGRISTLLEQYPFVKYCDSCGTWTKYVTVHCIGGYEYTDSGVWLINTLQKASLTVYFAWLNDFT